jgi:hypothetical protein
MRLAALSTNRLLIRANKSNHSIQVDEPGLVVGAIRRVHEYLQFVAPRHSHLKKRARVVVPGDQEDFALGKKLTDFNRGFNAIHLRHYNSCHEVFELAVGVQIRSRDHSLFTNG